MYVTQWIVQTLTEKVKRLGNEEKFVFKEANTLTVKHTMQVIPLKKCIV
jgi:hypothetical protein